MNGQFDQLQPVPSFTSDVVVRFRQQLRRQIPGQLPVGWDGVAIHRRGVVTEFLTREMGQRQEGVPWPGYGPELSPMELVWRYLIAVDLKTLGGQQVRPCGDNCAGLSPGCPGEDVWAYAGRAGLGVRGS